MQQTENVAQSKNFLMTLAENFKYSRYLAHDQKEREKERR